jgi:hypothetical protein
MHSLSNAYSAADAVESNDYPQWAHWIRQGRVERVIAALHDHQRRIGEPPDKAHAGDPRQRVHRGLVYYENNQSRMDCPRYRQPGLPLTSRHIESTIKQINRRIKGGEKPWSKATSEAVPRLRADDLSDPNPLDTFWLRHQARQTGSNAYRLTS